VGEKPLGQISQGVERVVELVGAGGVGQAEAEVVRGDHVVAVGQQRDQVAEHERAGREAVQQQEDGCVGRACLAVEQGAAVDGCVAVIRHV
jgi:hypothetical protein